MPVLLEARHIEIEFADMNRLVSNPKGYDGPRSNGVHLSGVIKCVLEAAGMLTADDLDDLMPLRMCVGMAWEMFIVQLWPEMSWQPQEYCLDGVYGSPDGFTGDTLEEVKATWTSRLEKSEARGVRPPAKNILNQKRWMMQLAGYCKMMGLTRARLHVLWVNGDYRGSGPQYFTYLIQFTQHEIDRMWVNMILPNVPFAIAESHG